MTVCVRPIRTATDGARSLEIYNRVWPGEAVTAEQAAAWRASHTLYAEFLAEVDGDDAGSAVAAANETRPGICFTLVTVLSEARGRGAGSALYAAVSEWASRGGLTELDCGQGQFDDPRAA